MQRLVSTSSRARRAQPSRRRSSTLRRPPSANGCAGCCARCGRSRRRCSRARRVRESVSVRHNRSRARCALRDLCVMLMGHTAHTQEGGGSALLRLSAEKGAARGSRRVRRGERGAGSLESPRGDLAHNSFFCFFNTATVGARGSGERRTAPPSLASRSPSLISDLDLSRRDGALLTPLSHLAGAHGGGVSPPYATSLSRRARPLPRRRPLPPHALPPRLRAPFAACAAAW
mmetsp:Transcript_51929/g.173322  ORF Transcript_51929/g.173322 Transcript_51929/m.173322 type:complete len:231 (-) Transcript_51929:427-1119(-)